MELILNGNELRVKCSGLENLKLKSLFFSRIGNRLRADRTGLSIPVCAIPLISDLISSDLNPEVDAILKKYAKHERARLLFREVMESESCGCVPQEWLEKLDPAQSIAVAAMVQDGLLGLCLFDEQGTGKTVMALAAFDILRSQNIIDAMIVVCPKSMLYEWPKDIDRFLPQKYRSIVVESGKPNKNLNDFEVIVLNYEAIDSIRIKLSAFTELKRVVLVVDESYYVKNDESIRSVSTRVLRDNCLKCFVLCGTPAPNSPYDVINQFDLADMGFTFGAFDKSSDAEQDKGRIADLIETKGTFIRRLKAEILREIPEKNFHVISIPLKGRQAFMYEKARRSLELELRNLDNTLFQKKLVTYFQKRAALLQICSHPRSIDPLIAETPVKYEYLDNLLDKLIESGRKVIVWTFYRNGLEELFARYPQYNPVKIDGSTDLGARRDSVRLFQEDPTTMLFIGNPAAAGAGITLHSSYDAVYLSYSNQAAHYLQSLDRIHRRGQRSSEVNYYLLVGKGTIEETEVLRLRRKELNQHLLLGDDVKWPSSLDEALEELQVKGDK
jgi:SNF2 family DNA or RNA helicase